VARRFFDTSALAKLYHEEAGSDFMLRIGSERGAQHWISRLSVAEMESVLAGRVRSATMTVEDAAFARRCMAADLNQHRFLVAPVDLRHFSKASMLLQTYGVSDGLRTLDAIQMAVAMELAQTQRVGIFVASDKRLCRVAALAGLAITNPEAPGSLIVEP
jgi:predicted nucleic acid-binding protein